MSMTASFYQAAKVPPRRTGWIFTNPKFDFSASTPLDQKPRVRKRSRKPKFKMDSLVELSKIREDNYP